MKRVILGCLAALLATQASAGDGSIRKVGKPVKNQYIVRLSDSLRPEAVRSLALSLGRQHGGKLHQVWGEGVPGFAVELPEGAARAISRHPLVEYVEQNAEWTIHQGQQNAPWHLDRLDQRALPLDTFYGQGWKVTDVFAYVLDNGVRGTHHEFWTSAQNSTSRVLPGANVLGDGQPANSPCAGVTVFSQPTPPCGIGDKECLAGGHGTAVASILGGLTYGVAKGVKIIPVRAVRCSGESSSFYMSEGLKWIYNDKPSRIGPAVLNISSGTDMRGASAADEQAQRTYVEEWIDRLIDDRDITVVVSANNQEIDASLTSPARMARGNGGRVISVGGSTNRDRRWRCNPANAWEACNQVTLGSNHGEAVDIFAPAQNIPSAGIKEMIPPDDPLYPFGDCCRDSDTAERQGARSGTSFAAPVVAGVVARMLVGTGAALKPDQVWSRILSEATNGVMTEDAGDPDSGPLDTSPNRLVFRQGEPRPSHAGDFNGDGRADLVWRNSATGANVVWYMNGATKLGSALLPPVADTNWRIEAVADFDGNGHPDLFWRNYATGGNALWLLQGVTFLTSVPLPGELDLNWSVAGAADFSGDGKPDLVWRHQATGGDAVWVLGVPGAVTDAMALPGLTDFSWKLGAVGDFNRDGPPDLMWQNPATGAVAIWAMHGAGYLTNYVMQGTAAAPWRLAGRADYNADGRLDLVWRDITTGGDAYWFLGSSPGTVGSTPAFPSEPDLSWQIVGPR